MLTAIIVAGGSSQRMGFDKTFALLGGKPVIAHSIAAFEASDSVSEIILVGRAEKLAELEEIVRAENFRKVARIIAGGARRQDSVTCGLGVLSDAVTFVAVHDAARPLIRPELIERVYQLAREHGGSATAAPVVDTLKRADDQDRVTGGVARAGLFAVQTPQIFRRDLIEEAYRAVAAAGAEITDDISALECIQGQVVLLPNDQPNFKITYPTDLSVGEILLTRSRNQL
ncbi:MAG: 2-C-methyl-D-erythritol 4-phosphate cytidylyltransferase [Chthoniobacterales bacterium]